jgi:hypothetical protein
VPATIPLAGNVRASEVLLGRPGVVSRATQGEVAELMASAIGEWEHVMNLDEVRFGAAPALLIHERALPLIALVDLTT